MTRLFSGIAFMLFSIISYAQADRWQQAVKYDMAIDFDVKKHQFEGSQKLTYTNNSPDTLEKVFYHLYFNAFQPKSVMDMRSRTIRDADPRVASRIAALKPEEMGWHAIKSLKQNGKNVKFEVVGTILEVALNEPILPQTETLFEMEFESQVPVQIRRSGRDNAEGVDYSMSQWYPKLCEYDYQGWHANPYVGREFYGVWGDFDVKINIDKDYTIGGSGYLQNPNEIGHGYAPVSNVKAKGNKLTWHFIAPNVHDFVWAADTEYTHTTMKRKDGMTMHFFYIETENNKDAWETLPEVMDEAFEYINKNAGQYPYEQYSFIQGGDGGMEYPMATLITGNRSLSSLVGVSVHELIHSWYQMILGTNESLYAWMDEGFTSWLSDEVMNHLRGEGLIPGIKVKNPHLDTYDGFVNFTKSGFEEPLSIHADHFLTNAAYGVGAYVKGDIFLSQLKYIIGDDAFAKGMLRYFHTWKFKHPNPNDFIRVMEKESGLELDWYKEYWVNTTHTIDYAVGSATPVEGQPNKTLITLEKLGVMPMPLDVQVVFKNGKTQYYNIPLAIMRGHKFEKKPNSGVQLLEDWHWTHPSYEFTLDSPVENIDSIKIDPERGMVDIDTSNNILQK
ncbi:MAG TPA: M1 family metallopeptidase [Saprospiraceae bacterium]|nr:M1 family metallopeptidase [Saprospiraceae bacterium]HMQ83354.1 M1 family metallopeptidase [Saprospiraceae bacterium]